MNDWATQIEEITRSNEPQLLTKKETASLLRVSMRTVERMVQAGELPVVRIRNSPRYRLADVSRIVREGTR
jgi:excisionase family DNA binding protein